MGHQTPKELVGLLRPALILIASPRMFGATASTLQTRPARVPAIPALASLSMQSTQASRLCSCVEFLLGVCWRRKPHPPRASRNDWLPNAWALAVASARNPHTTRSMVAGMHLWLHTATKCTLHI